MRVSKIVGDLLCSFGGQFEFIDEPLCNVRTRVE